MLNTLPVSSFKLAKSLYQENERLAYADFRTKEIELGVHLPLLYVASPRGRKE